MRIRFTKFKSYIILVAASGCIDPYESPVSNGAKIFLVVDGFLNATESSASVRLSRTSALSESTAFESETNAAVSIESEDGSLNNLIERENGLYEISNLNINISSNYKLNVRTKDGKEYGSDFIELKQSPEIDSITLKSSAKGITLYANTHDPSNNTYYYRWLFTETWEYNAHFYSSYKIINKTVVPRPLNESIHTCWSINPISKILVYSTLPLSKDQVSNFPLVFIERGSEKISKTYSILVTQRALSEKAYTYWSQLQKTTENLGGLFGPLPYELKSNVFNINDASEAVLGYFSGGNIKQKRIFIRFEDLPDYLSYIPPTGCEEYFIPLENIPLYNDATMLTNAVYKPLLIGYSTTTTSCADCRYFGGTTTKPDFWP